ncbi:MAG: hypothetical protein JXA46_08430 [Dehalococcoidales bacterium]|nr:hypothetical protein [Dehalococcoidales bacterium]
MGEIKSAREIAMEKIDKIGEATEDERLEWKYVPEGEKLAARHLKQAIDLAAEVKKFDKKASKYVIRGINTVLIKNIDIPRDDAGKRTNKLSMDGIKAIKTDKTRVEAVLNQIRHVFNHYSEQGEQQLKQAYDSLKADFQAKVEQALRQQGASMSGVRIDIEKQPQFQEEWRKLKIQLEGQYTQVLTEYKNELEAIP